MAIPSEETLATLKGLRTELIASKALFHPEGFDNEWNRALDKAVRFVDNYIEGKGLYQLIPEKHDKE